MDNNKGVMLMKLANTLVACGVLSSLLLMGCVSKVAQKEQYSGFLGNYDGLQETTSPSDATVLRWVTPSFKASRYSTVVFNDLALYPAPKPTERVDLKTLQELQAYTIDSAKLALSHHYIVVSRVADVPAGSHALILRAAITGVTASNEGMKWYEVVPVAAVIGVTQAASGYRDQTTELYVEAELVDATTSQPVAKVVRKVFGESLSNAHQPITVNDFKVAISVLTNDMQMVLLR